MNKVPEHFPFVKLALSSMISMARKQRAENKFLDYVGTIELPILFSAGRQNGQTTAMMQIVSDENATALWITRDEMLARATERMASRPSTGASVMAVPYSRLDSVRGDGGMSKIDFVVIDPAYFIPLSTKDRNLISTIGHAGTIVVGLG